MLVIGIGGLIFFLGLGLRIAEDTGRFPMPFVGLIVMAIGGFIMGLSAVKRNPKSQLDQAFDWKVQTRLSEYREWANARTFLGCRLLQYGLFDLIGARDVPIPRVEQQIQELLCKGLQVDWAGHQGRLYLRVWDVGCPEPDWKKVLAEQPLVDAQAIQAAPNPRGL
jgi:hypothetical protein